MTTVRRGQEKAMATWLVEVRDSDGNDCTVYDVQVGADTAGSALEAVWAWVNETWPEDEEDGCQGTYHPCDCECEHGINPWEDELPSGSPHKCRDRWECSHGGVLVGDPELAGEHVPYHLLIDLTEKTL